MKAIFILIFMLSTKLFASIGTSCLSVVAATNSVATVVSLQKVTESTLNLRLKKPDGYKANPGEAAKLTLHNSDGQPFRFLSISNSTHSEFLEFTVRISDSQFKQAFLNLKSGDQVTVSPPRGALKFNSEKPAVMIAGGIGITPFRSLLQSLKDEGSNNLITLLYANRNPQEIAFREEFDLLSSSMSNFQVRHIVSEKTPDWTGDVGRIDQNYLTNVIQQHPTDTLFYIVGPPAMVKATKENLTQIGVTADRIIVEMFAGYKTEE